MVVFNLGYSQDHGCGGFQSESALVIATQEQRDDEVLSSLEASSATF